mmetsp:Transcript_24627/g.57351  ORF Transcript_24627/g.57351 Transcript_24627/m.57351 type:complete len:142 (+) Transcript_24627:441-866(+)
MRSTLRGRDGHSTTAASPSLETLLLLLLPLQKIFGYEHSAIAADKLCLSVSSLGSSGSAREEDGSKHPENFNESSFAFERGSLLSRFSFHELLARVRFVLSSSLSIGSHEPGRPVAVADCASLVRTRCALTNTPRNRAAPR